ncbi:MAG: hypothetical protein R2792_19005 [Saprospiraceae bacterium]
MEKLEKAGGFGLLKKETQVEFIDLGTHYHYMLQYILGILGVVLVVNGLAQFQLGETRLASIFTAAGVLCLGGLFYLRLQKSKKETGPFTPDQILGIIDFENRVFLIPSEQKQYTLKDTKFVYTYAFFSSGKNLVARHPDGEVLLARSNPLALAFSPFKSFFDELYQSIPKK